MSGLKIIPGWISGGEEEIWIATIPYHKIALGKQNFNEINFRIMRSTVNHLIAGTKCQPRPRLKFFWDYNFNY